MSSTPNRQLTESEVVKLWQQQMQKQRQMTDADGEPVEVIYPGRLNDSRGGDFRDALVASGDTCRQGCIEIHTRVSGWQAHGHHQDPEYNQVVLHVALEQDRPGETRLQNGESIPTIILRNSLTDPPNQNDSMGGLPCQGLAQRLSPAAIGIYLESAGNQRLTERTLRYFTDIPADGAGQSLYQGLAEALGYAKNQLPFRKLAHQLPLQQLSETWNTARSEEESQIRVQSRLLGASGLLPSQRGKAITTSDYVNRIESTWAGEQYQSLLTQSDWELYKVRPGNFPVRRIIALSGVYLRYRNNWLQSLVDLVRQVPDLHPYYYMESGLMVTEPGYWAYHYDFDRSNPLPNPVLIGRPRAATIIINVLLPFTLAWSRLTADTLLERKVRDLYSHYPRIESNALERHMQEQLGLNPRLVNSARRQQGLIHIYKSFCTRGKCKDCILPQ